MDKLHVLEIKKVYWKYILDVLIDDITDHLKGKISIMIEHSEWKKPYMGGKF